MRFGFQSRPNLRVPSRSRLSPSPVRFGWERVGVRGNYSGRFPVKQRVPSQRQSKAPLVQSPKSGLRAARFSTLDFGP